MNSICSICSDNLVQIDNIFHTQCGHVFHLHCLTQWLERSKSCPQCREKVSRSKIHRLYFTFANNEVVETQASSLQERIDNLQFRIALKEKDIQHYTSKCVTLQKQNAGLRKEVKNLEDDVRKQTLAIHALKEQANYFKEQSSRCDNLKREITQLKNKIEDLKPIQMLLHTPSTNIREMVGNSKDPEVLLTYISVMKKELCERFSKCKQLRMTIKKLQEKLDKLGTKYDFLVEEQSKRMDLEEKLAISESKNLPLKKRVEELKEVLSMCDNCNTRLIEQTEEISDSFEESPVEKILQEEKNDQQTSFKIPKLSKRRKEKASNDSINCTKEELPSIHLNDSSDSDVDFVNSNLSPDSAIAYKKSRISPDDENILRMNDSNLTNYSLSKSISTKVSQSEKAYNSNIIDLT